MNANIWLTSQVDFSIYSVHMYKPFRIRINQEKNFKNFRYIEFVTTPVTFNLKFSKNHDFDDLGKAVTNIVNLMCSNGPGGCVGAQGCVEHGLEFSRSNLRSKTV